MNAEPATAPVARSRVRVRYNAAMKTLRRAHMYSGLALAPFVLVYGVSAVLFNHPDWFSDRPVRFITAQDMAETPLKSFPNANALATRVVAAINNASRPAITLSQARSPFYTRDFALTAITAEGENTISLDLDGHTGSSRTVPTPEPSAKPPWARESIHLDSLPLDAVKDSINALMTKWGNHPESVKVRASPELVFAAESNGGLWRVGYNLNTEALTVRPFGNDVSSRRWLTGMHLARRYPSQFEIRWVWAVIVDALGALMVFWGVSGLLMWWQMKSLRRLGAVVVLLSLIISALIAIGMHDVIGR